MVRVHAGAPAGIGHDQAVAGLPSTAAAAKASDDSGVACATGAGQLTGGGGSASIEICPMSSVPAWSPPASTTTSTRAVLRGVRSDVGPHANCSCRRRIVTVRQSAVTVPGAGRYHQTLSPEASTNLISIGASRALERNSTRITKLSGNSTGIVRPASANPALPWKSNTRRSGPSASPDSGATSAPTPSEPRAVHAAGSPDARPKTPATANAAASVTTGRLALDRATQESPDVVPLQNEEQRQNRQDREHRARHHHFVVLDVLA